MTREKAQDILKVIEDTDPNLPCFWDEHDRPVTTYGDIAELCRDYLMLRDE